MQGAHHTAPWVRDTTPLVTTPTRLPPCPRRDQEGELIVGKMVEQMVYLLTVLTEQTALLVEATTHTQGLLRVMHSSQVILGLIRVLQMVQQQIAMLIHWPKETQATPLKVATDGESREVSSPATAKSF